MTTKGVVDKVRPSTSLEEIVARHPVRPNTAELEQWEEILMPDDAYNLFAKDNVSYDIAVGLFAHDLTGFLEDCSISRDCDHSTYSNLYDGWLVGAYFAMDIFLSWYTNYESMFVCLQDNSCFGIETYYTTLDTLEMRYYIDKYAWYETDTLSLSVPSADIANECCHYAGFSDRLFYSTAQDWFSL